MKNLRATIFVGNEQHIFSTEDDENPLEDRSYVEMIREENGHVFIEYDDGTVEDYHGFPYIITRM